MKSAPFLLPWGTKVYAKVIATNKYGNSLISEPGFEANLVTNPDPPVNLVEVKSSRTLTTLGISWSDGAYNGGDYIIDYRVSIADESGIYQVIASNLIQTSYTATSLIPGVTYSFKV